MARSANEVWIDLLAQAASSTLVVAPRGEPIRELIAKQTAVDMSRPVVTCFARKLGRRFMAAEAWWILSGRNDVASISPYSKEISKFSNDGRRFDGAYGPQIIDQLRYVCDSLIADQDTRQSVLTIWRRNPRPSLDVPCTVSCQWLIRMDRAGVLRLHCIDTMRSSDVWLGIPYDWFNFSMLSATILLTLRDKDPKFKGLQLGDLYLTAGSQHIYERNFVAVESVFNDPKFQEYAPLDLEEFQSPEALIDHLAALKDRGQTSRRWLTDLIN